MGCRESETMLITVEDVNGVVHWEKSGSSWKALIQTWHAVLQLPQGKRHLWTWKLRQIFPAVYQVTAASMSIIWCMATQDMGFWDSLANKSKVQTRATDLENRTPGETGRRKNFPLLQRAALFRDRQQSGSGQACGEGAGGGLVSCGRRCTGTRVHAAAKALKATGLHTLKGLKRERGWGPRLDAAWAHFLATVEDMALWFTQDVWRHTDIYIHTHSFFKKNCNIQPEETGIETSCKHHVFQT